ncbi:nonsense-mediated mRNA decay factor SMG8 isoform X2 [Oratosquilla oratoria]
MTFVGKKVQQRGNFKFPLTWTPKDVERADQRIVVVSVFGKSSLESGGCKASIIEHILGRQVFNRNLIQKLDLNQDTLSGLEGYYDPGGKAVYLHLTGVFDSPALIMALENMKEEIQSKGFLMAWSNLKLSYARSLLFLFSISHILLLYHPTHIFDMSSIHLFRTLDSVRSKAQSVMGELLRGVPGISKEWVSFGRPCSPRVLFIFSSRLLPLSDFKASIASASGRMGAGFVGKGRPSALPPNPLRNLEHALEDQIYRLLRKSRVITNISANSLFALPNNQAYVYILEEDQETPQPTSLIQSTLEGLCSAQDTLSSDLSQLCLDSWDSSLSMMDKGSSMASVLSSNVLSAIAIEKKRNLDHSFRVFLQQHMDQAQGKGFDDNVGRHPGPGFFEVPKARVWFEASSRLYKFFVMEAGEKELKAKQVVSRLRSLLETELRFSSARCYKVLPLAIAAYKEGLPPHYTQMHHQEMLEVAMNVLSTQARGPMYESFVGQLEEECEHIWRDSRMGCEVLSLTGSTCKHPKHRLNGEEDPDSSLPVMSHSSGVVYTSVCNCGRRQGQREDPFSLKAANLTFYQQLSESCCSRLDSFQFATFKPSISNAKAASFSTCSDKMASSYKDQAMKQENKEKDDPTTSEHNTPGLSLGQSGGGLSETRDGTSMTADNSNTGSQVIITLMKEDTKAAPKERGMMVRQASTTEYLPGMLHSASHPGLLPRWSSWSLVCLGPSSLYSHNIGICDQPGFLTGTNFLLPWDVTVKIEDRDKWPAIADTLGKKAHLLKNHNEFNVKIFLGVEYECGRGHRFMMASPDRPLKASPLGLVKDNATKIANADMPLYFPCPCSRGGNVINGQLLRIHVVTPKAPVNVILKPYVQPGPDPGCPQYTPQPSASPPIKLSPSTYWILRLPYVYVSDSGPHYPPDPRQPAPPAWARLLKGCYGISQVTLDR